MIMNLLGCIICLLSSCSSKNQPAKQVVPTEISVRYNNNYQLDGVNFNFYSLKVLDRLEDFNVVNLSLADEGDTATIIVNIDINNYNRWPAEERATRRVFRRSVPAGTDAKGQTVYKTVTASADIVSIRIRANAVFNTQLTIRGNPGKNYKRTFSSNLNWDNVYVNNIQGDTRALDPSLLSASIPPIPPTEDEILLALSNREMLEILSREIRSYYDK